MEFKNNFYLIDSVDHTDNEHSYVVTIDKTHEIFNGHFPGNPVTPGVVQLEMIKELTEDIIGQKCALKELINCKFLKVLNPEFNPQVMVGIKIIEGTISSAKVSATISNKEETFLKASASYQLA